MIKRSPSGLAVGVTALTTVLGLWLMLHAEPSLPAEPAPLTAAPLPAAPLVARTSLERATDGLPVMPHDPVSTAVVGPVHPHPHTPTHERLHRENNLVGQLSGAMDQKDLLGLRLLLARYADEYPEDAHRLQEGYALIADCLEGPTEEARTRAELYYREQRGSTLRRYVRRHCLEPR